jgi:imidazolonepropionase-like amidohydrolase
MTAWGLVLLAFGLQGAEVTVVKGGRVEPVSGREIEGGVVVCEGGKIRKVGGAEVPVPPGATVIEVPAGSWVVPGFVDPHSHLGSAFEVEEPTESLTPHVKAVEAFMSGHRDVREALGSGVTRVALAPGNGNLVGGRIGLIKVNGERYDRALWRDAVALKASLSEEALRRDREPTSRTGAARLLRGFLRGAPPETPLFIHASTSADLHAALEVAGERRERLVLVGASEAGEMEDSIRAAGAGVVFAPLTVSDRREVLEAPGRLARAGIRIAFATDSPRCPEEQLRASAAFAVKYGLAREAALRALTLGPAELLGVARDLGSLEEGKEADVVVWTGDPLHLTSAVETVVIGGKVTYRRARP